MTSSVPNGLLHATVVAGDLARSLAFYDAALDPLGIRRHSEFPDEEEDAAPADAVAYATLGQEPILWVVTGPLPTRGLHLALRAADRTEVERFWTAGCGPGAGRRAPRRWAIYRDGYYGAILADPDGNLVEAAARE